MAKKRHVGIPAGFNLNLDDPELDAVQEPVKLGDIFEEEERAQRVGSPKAAPTAPPPSADPKVVDTPQTPPKKARKAVRDRRKSIHLPSELTSELNALVRLMSDRGPEPTIKTTEVLEGLIRALYEARGTLDLSSVHPRGQWGSPTARAFPYALRDAFKAAIIESAGAD